MRGISMNLYFLTISNSKNLLKQIFNLIFLIGPIIFILYLGYKNNLLLFASIFSIFYIIWDMFLDFKSYVYITNEITITNDLNLKYNGLKYFQKYDVELELQKCKYFLIKTTIKSANYSLQINYENDYVYFGIGETECLEIYKILKEKFPENDLGQKWKYIIIGNTW